MGDKLKMKLYSFTVDCLDPQELAGFYGLLLGWEMVYHNEEYAVIAPGGTAQGAYPGITFQRNPDYRPPVWPDTAEAQQQMAHIDIAVNNLEEAVAHAVRHGATAADTQYSDDWRVLLDPARHPFCLCALNHIFEE